MQTRRAVLASLAATALPFRATAAASDAIPLWPGSPPGGGGPEGDVRIGARGSATNIAQPSMRVFAPNRASGAAVLIAAGGGYRRIENGKEAEPAASWLAARGVTAFIMNYRLPPEGWGAGPLAPLQDAQRALRLIRARADGFGVDPERVGVLGFSAGGHLLGLAAARSDFASYPPADAVDGRSARPGFAALIYPIVTLEPPYDDTSTRRVLIGRRPTPQLAADWSIQTHIRPGQPPMFLAQAQDDPISDPANTEILAQACGRAGVPVELRRLSSGGHGFGMGREGSPTRRWPDWYAAWLGKVAGLGPG